jgi:uncharacterized protein
MTQYPLTFQETHLLALPSGALFWPDRQLLCVSDLHLGRSERLARRGGALLPPYENEATLARLDAEIEAWRPARVICLGDSFDDLAAEAALDDRHRLWLLRLMAGRDWIWVEGNHDPGPGDIGGSHRAVVTDGAITFRHIAIGQAGEICGHHHPKARLAGLSRPCFLTSAARIILPAFGAYTGGLPQNDPAFDPLFPNGGLAILTHPKGGAMLAMPRSAAPASRDGAR